MDRIIGKASKYLNTSVLLLLTNVHGEQEILFEKRHPDISQGNEICLPGGRIDPSMDTTSEQAAIREACEELGVAPDKIAVTRYLGTAIATLGVAVDAFAGELKIDSWEEISPNAAEVQALFTIPVAWFKSHAPEEYWVRLEVYPFELDAYGRTNALLPGKELGIPEKYHQSWNGGTLPIYVYRTDYGIIWGVTAEIVREFVQIIDAPETKDIAAGNALLTSTQKEAS